MIEDSGALNASGALARELLDGPNPPTAIVTFNDWIAMDAMAAAYDLGRRVPDDVSVVGFADLRVASAVRPRLTTVAQDPTAIGRRAAGRLLEQLGVGGAGMDAAAPQPGPVHDRIAVRLVAGESTRARTAR